MTSYNSEFNEDLFDLYYHLMAEGMKLDELEKLSQDDRKQLLGCVISLQDEFEAREQWDDDLDYQLVDWLFNNLDAKENPYQDIGLMLKNSAQFGFAGVFKYFAEKEPDLVLSSELKQEFKDLMDTECFEEGWNRLSRTFHSHYLKLKEIYLAMGGSFSDSESESDSAEQ